MCNGEIKHSSECHVIIAWFCASFTLQIVLFMKDDYCPLQQLEISDLLAIKITWMSLGEA